MYHPVAIDFETTGKDAKTARPIEWAIAPVDPNKGFDVENGFIALPPGETIPPETSAVHHIIDEDLIGAPDWEDTLEWLAGLHTISEGDSQLVLVAHNAEYEQDILRDSWFAAGKVPWVCTFKCALLAWPDAPSHSNEALRYWLRLGDDRGRGGNQKPHSALHDAVVTAGIFRTLYGFFSAQLADKLGQLHILSPEAQKIIVDHMIDISSKPAQLPTCPIGDYRGKPWSEVPASFLNWMINKPIDRADAIHCARKELVRRRG